MFNIITLKLYRYSNYITFRSPIEENTIDAVGKNSEPLATLSDKDASISNPEDSLATVNEFSMDEDFEMTEEEEAQFTKMAKEKLQKFDGDKVPMDSEFQEDTDNNVSI